MQPQFKTISKYPEYKTGLFEYFRVKNVVTNNVWFKGVSIVKCPTLNDAQIIYGKYVQVLNKFREQREKYVIGGYADICKFDESNWGAVVYIPEIKFSFVKFFDDHKMDTNNLKKL